MEKRLSLQRLYRQLSALGAAIPVWRIRKAHREHQGLFLQNGRAHGYAVGKRHAERKLQSRLCLSRPLLDGRHGHARIKKRRKKRGGAALLSYFYSEKVIACGINAVIKASSTLTDLITSPVPEFTRNNISPSSITIVKFSYPLLPEV